MAKISKLSFNLYDIKAQGFRVIRHIPKYGKGIRRKKYGEKPILTTEEGRKVLRSAIVKGAPFMAARFGTSEGLALQDYWRVKLNYGDKPERLSNKYLRIMCNNAGFFEASLECVGKPNPRLCRESY